MTQQHVPVRTCVVTRKRAPQGQLVRVVIDQEQTARRLAAGETVTVVVPDPGGRLPGRGAWITPDVTCAQLAVQRRAFERALRTPHRVDATEVLAYVSGLVGVDTPCG